MVLRPVKDAKDDDVVPDNSKKDLIGETMGQDTAKALIINRELFGISLQAQQGFSVVREKFVAQAYTLFFIPIMRTTEIGLGLGPDGNAPVHRRDARISRRTFR